MAGQVGAVLLGPEKAFRAELQGFGELHNENLEEVERERKEEEEEEEEGRLVLKIIKRNQILNNFDQGNQQEQLCH